MGKSMKVIKGYFLSFFGLAVLLVCMKGMIVHAADESNIRELFSQGQVAFDEGQDDHALSVFDKITQTSGREEWLIDLRSRAFVEKSRIYYRQHAYLPAIDNCYFAILESPNFFDAHYHRGKAYLARHDYDKAIRTFTRATQIDPESALALSHLGFARGAKGDINGCIELQEKAIKLNDQLAVAYARRGAAKAAKNDIQRAREDVEKALSMDSRLCEALCIRARLKAASGDLKGAAQDADRAIESQPAMARAHLERGFIWMWQDNGAAALPLFEEAIRLDPREPEAFLARAQIRLSARDYELSKKDFSKVIELSPKLMGAYAGRAEVHKRLHDMEAFRADLQMAEQLRPVDPSKKKRAITKSELPPRFELLSKGVDPSKHDDVMNAAKKIDELVQENYDIHQITPMPRSEDSHFVRRLYLDIVGRIPTYLEVNRFLHSQDPAKRTKLIDDLLARDEYAQHFFNYWADVFRYRDRPVGDYVRGEPWRQWIKQSLAENMPWDEMVQAMLTAEGATWDNPATGYLQRDPGMPLDIVNNTVRIFLGTRIGCAQCHNHPFDSWTQKQFYEAAAFMFGTRTEIAGGDKRFFAANPIPKLREDFDAIEQEEEDRRRQSYEFDRHMRRNRMIVHDNVSTQLSLPANYAYDDAKPHETVRPKVLFGSDVTFKPGETPRQGFARWLASADNPRFALTIANRLWKRAFGAGQIEPEDDMSESTIAANPPLMEFLEKLMRDLDFDMKEFQRVLYNTETYQRQACCEEVVAGKPYHVPGPMLRRMTAEQAWDSILTLAVYPMEYREPPASLFAEAVSVDLNKDSAEDLITSIQKLQAIDQQSRELKKPYTYKGNLLARASELPSPLPANHFLRMFGQSDRQLIQASSTWGSVPQVLFMFNGQISHMLLEKNSTIYNNIIRKKTIHDGIDVCFLTILSRNPTEDELLAAMKEVKEIGPAGYGNVVWSLLNTREFLFIQ